MVCKNHPSVEARRKCYQCKKPVCPGCQDKAYHHIFCGKECIETFKSNHDHHDPELKELLSNFDQSLNEDLREYGDVIVEELSIKLNALQQSFLEQASHSRELILKLNQSFSETSAEHQDAQKQWATELKRSFGESSDYFSDQLKQNQKTLLATRKSLDDQVQAFIAHQNRITETYLSLIKRKNRSDRKRDKLQKELQNSQFEQSQDLAVSQFRMIEGRAIEHFQTLSDALKNSLQDLQSRILSTFEQNQDELKRNLHSLKDESHQKIEDLDKRTQSQLTEFQGVVESRTDHIAGQMDQQSKEVIGNLSHVVSEKAKDLLDVLRSSVADQEESLSAGKRLLIKEIEQKHADLKSHMREVDDSHKEQLQTALQALQQLQTSTKEELETLRASVSSTNRKMEELFERSAEVWEQTQQRQIKAFHQSFEELFDAQKAEFEAWKKTTYDENAKLKNEVHKNWFDVIAAASMGAKSAGMDLRSELDKKLRSHLDDLTQEHQGAVKEIVGHLREGIKKKLDQTLSPWFGKAGLWLSGASFAVVLACGVLLLTRKTGVSEHTETHSLTEVAEKNQAELYLKLENIEEQMKALADKLDAGTKKIALSPAKDQKLPQHTIRGLMTKKEFALTFDGGSNARSAVQILDFLKQNNIHSTMFLTKAFIEQNPDIVRRISNEGHEAGNHLLVHEHLIDEKNKRTIYTRERLMSELHQVEQAYLQTTGKPMKKLWRAPFGEINSELINWAASAGYTHVGWSRSGRISLDSLDWVVDRTQKLYRTPDQIAAQVLKFEKEDRHGINGGIILMHLGSEREGDQMAYLALPTIVNNLGSKGYRAVTVTELLTSDVASN